MATAKRNAKIELTSSAAGVDKGLNDARRKLRAFQRDQEKQERAAEKARARTAKATIGFGRSVATGMAAAAGFDVAGGIGGLVGDVFDTEREMTRFQIDAQLGADKMATFRDQLMKTSEATGVSRNSLVRGAHAYQILTGDAEGAVKATSLFADVANASGASIEDIAATAASLKQNLGFDPADFRKGFDVLLSMGHKGSVELRDLAGEMAGLAPQFKDFGQKSATDKLAEMGATMQVVRKNFGDASEMATGFRSLMTAVTKKQGELGAHGVRVFEIDPKTKKAVKRDFLDIIGDIIKNPALDEKVLPKLLGRQEAVRALGAMRDHWDEIAQLQQESANSNQVAVDANTYMESASGRIAKAWEHVKNSLAAAFTPERIDAFAGALGRAADYFAKIVGFADHLAQWAGGAPTDVHVANAEQEDFLFPAMEGGNQGEAEAVKRAQSVLAANDPSDISDTGLRLQTYAHGGLANEQAAARRFLVNNGNMKADPWDAGRTGGAGALDAKAFARELVVAMKAAGIGALKIGGPQITEANNNNVRQRTRPGGR